MSRLDKKMIVPGGALPPPTSWRTITIAVLLAWIAAIAVWLVTLRVMGDE